MSKSAGADAGDSRTPDGTRTVAAASDEATPTPPATEGLFHDVFGFRPHVAAVPLLGVRV